jgi:hypothetical protein
LKQLINDLEHKVLGVEILELIGHFPINLVEVHASSSLVLFELLRNELLKLISLVSNLVEVVVSFAF